MATELESKKGSLRDWFFKKTEFENIKYRLLDAPEEGFSAWARTTAGIVAFLFFLQFLTGFLLAFHYVPTIENAYTTVAYIELAVKNGSWIRSLHYHASILLPLAMIAHLAQMIIRNAYLRLSTAWTFTLIFLALVLAAAATGYVLPWDARAFNGANVALSLAGNAPLIGAAQKLWLQNGEAISTLTISRFYALHVFVIPMLILLCIAARLFFFGRKEGGEIDAAKFKEWAQAQFIRNSIAIGAVFLGISFFAAKYSAPLAPSAKESASYLSRPGPQFLWLFELQKHTDGLTAAVLSFGFPALIIGGLLLIPFFSRRISKHRLAVSALFILGFGIIGALTLLTYLQDARDPRTREQLAKQQKEEMGFRASGFKPQPSHLAQNAEKTEKKSESSAANKENQTDNPALQQNVEVIEAPKVYKTHCAKCHGANGEGTKLYPSLEGVTTREEEPLSDEMLLAIINDAKSVGLSSKMPAYKNKLTEDEKQEIIRWIKTLK